VPRVSDPLFNGIKAALVAAIDFGPAHRGVRMKAKKYRPTALD